MLKVFPQPTRGDEGGIDLIDHIALAVLPAIIARASDICPDRDIDKAYGFAAAMIKRIEQRKAADNGK